MSIYSRLLLDGRLILTRVERVSVSDALQPVHPDDDQTRSVILDLTPRFLVMILCNDILVLCKDQSGGRDSKSFLDLCAAFCLSGTQSLLCPATVERNNGEYADY